MKMDQKYNMEIFNKICNRLDLLDEYVKLVEELVRKENDTK